MAVSELESRGMSPRTVGGLVAALDQVLEPLRYPALGGDVVHVDACCGLGHRLVRNASIYHLARTAGFAVGILWFPWFDLFADDVALFAARAEDRCAILFEDGHTDRHTVMPLDAVAELGAYEPENLPSGASFGYAGCADEAYWAKEVFGPASLDHVADFHRRLLRQLRPNRQWRIDSFAAEHLATRRVVGFHLRTGNGEGGDFARKPRGLDVTLAVDRFVDDVRSLDHRTHVVLVASDSPEPLAQLQATCPLEVVAWPSNLPAAGVVHGNFTSGETEVAVDRRERVEQSFDVYADMVLLSMADVLYIANWTSLLAGPVALNARRRAYGTSIRIHDRILERWMEV